MLLHVLLAVLFHACLCQRLSSEQHKHMEEVALAKAEQEKRAKLLEDRKSMSEKFYDQLDETTERTHPNPWVGATKHEPALFVDHSTGTVTVKVRGKDASVQNLHPQTESHYITHIFVTDQVGTNRRRVRAKRTLTDECR